MAEKSQMCPAFLDVAKAIAGATNLPAILQLIAEHTVGLTGAMAASVALLDPTGKRLQTSAVYGLSGQFLEKESIVDEDPIASDVLRGKTVVVPDMSSDARVTERTALSELGISALTAVEIAAGERPLGVLTVFKPTGTFSEDDMSLIYTMASLSAVGVETGSAFNRLYRRCADLGVLNQVAEDINVSLRTNEVIDAIVREVPLVLHAKGCSLRLYDPRTRQLTPVAVHGLKKGLLDSGPINLEDSPADEAALKGQVIVISDTLEDRLWRYPERAREEGIGSAIISPMIIKGKPVGTLWVFGDEPRVYSEEEKALLLAIARHSAIAIENARLYEISIKSHDQLVQEVWKGLPDVWATIAGQRRVA
ncbi:MAG: GAF domain-containing protein [Candidatus Aquicultorales bacterium]